MCGWRASLVVFVAVFGGAGRALAWTDADIGTTLPGSAVEEAGVWTLRGNGLGFHRDPGGCHFVYRYLKGDGEIVARVATFRLWELGSGYAGVMIRETLDETSTFIATVKGVKGTVECYYRGITGSYTFGGSQPNRDYPLWVRIVRQGDTFMGYFSPNGVEWTLRDSVTIPMRGPRPDGPYAGAYVGLVVTSGVAGELCEAALDNVRLTGEVVDQPAASVKARHPFPADGATSVILPVLQWSAGDTARWHDVYIGASPDLKPADLMGRVDAAMYRHGPGLTPGTTYYWRIDEVEPDGTTVHTGDVWKFTAASYTAGDPDPPDRARHVPVETEQLAWMPGFTSVARDVYFGTDRMAVAEGDEDAFRGNQSATTYRLSDLQPATTYSWRVDEYDAQGRTYPGLVWSFTTVGPEAGLRAYYFNNTDLSGASVLTRVDPEIDFIWAAGLPGIGVERYFSVRWVGLLEVERSEPYTFYMRTCNGGRLWIDGQLIVDNWMDHWITENQGTISLTGGRRYSIRMEYYHSGLDAVAQLSWESPSLSKQIIPAGALQLAVRASDPQPADGAAGVLETPVLSWVAGDEAAGHEIYLGDDPNAVRNADPTTPGIYRGRTEADVTSYLVPEALEWGRTYFWRVDEVNTAAVQASWQGDVWSFTVADYLLVDDFESYTDAEGDRIFETWIDGLGYVSPAPGHPGNGTGATVGYLNAPFAERVIVHRGTQSLPLEYDNTVAPYYSQAERTWSRPQDWTRNDLTTIALWVRGDPGNGSEPLYVSLHDAGGKSGTVTHPDPAATSWPEWQPWNMELERFAEAGVDLRAVSKLCIGVGNRDASQPGGTGRLFVDDVVLHRGTPPDELGE